MKCEELLSYIDDYFDGALSEEVEKDVLASLKVCEDAEIVYKRYDRFFKQVSKISIDIPAPKNLLKELTEELRQTMVEKKGKNDIEFEKSIKKETERLKENEEKKLKKLRKKAAKKEDFKIIKSTPRKNRKIFAKRTNKKAVTWLLIVLVLFSAGYLIVDMMKHNAPWEVRVLDGAYEIDNKINFSNQWDEGQTLSTNNSTKVAVNIPKQGKFTINPNSELDLVKAKDGDNKVELKNGSVRVSNFQTLAHFSVNVKGYSVLARGGEFEVLVDKDGFHTQVYSGAIEIVNKDHIIPVAHNYVCKIKTNYQPGTPYNINASELLKDEVARFDYSQGGDEAVDNILTEAVETDALTLWSLLPKVSDQIREKVFQELNNFFPIPPGLTKAGILRLDENMLELWWNDIEWRI